MLIMVRNANYISIMELNMWLTSLALCDRMENSMMTTIMATTSARPLPLPNSVLNGGSAPRFLIVESTDMVGASMELVRNVVLLSTVGTVSYVLRS